MPTDLAGHIDQLKVIDTHEHMRKEQDWIDNGPGDVLADLFSNYVAMGDLLSAGLDAGVARRLTDGSDPDIEGRWADVKAAWEAVQFTGYGEAVRDLAREVYGIEEITPKAVRAAQPRLEELRQPGQRLHLLRDVAGLDHVQVDDFVFDCLPDASGPDFFLYDISWASMCQGEPNLENLERVTGTTVTDLASLRDAMGGVFDTFAPCAIAVKSQHAYNRTLRWEERDDGDAERVLARYLRDPKDLSDEERLVLGDWCWARGIELAIEHDLPFKHHTGYYAGAGHMVTDRIRPGQMCPLFIKYPKARFVLMHIAWPYDDELLGLVKHFPSCWADLCWAWSMNPLASGEFVRRFLHAAPINKLFAFGGDTFWPTSGVAYTRQMRRWLTRVLQAEVDEGDLSEMQAIDVATRLLRGNQLACFDIEGTRSAIRLQAGG